MQRSRCAWRGWIPRLRIVSAAGGCALGQETYEPTYPNNAEGINPFRSL